MTSLLQFDAEIAQSLNLLKKKPSVPGQRHLRLCDMCDEVQEEQKLRKLERHRQEIKREMELSTELKTASFYYDFHLLEVYQQVVNDNVKLNLSFLLSHLLTNYYQAPNHSANFIKEIKLRIELGQSIDSSDKFYQFFYDHIADYEFSKTSSAP